MMKIVLGGNVNLRSIKGKVDPKIFFCHHLLTLKLFQNHMSGFLLLNTKEDILKNANQTVDGSHRLP